MIFQKQSFQYKNKTVMEKAIITPPYKHEGVFQNEGCFLYLKGAKGKVMSSKDNFHLNPTPKEAVLLKCDTYFLDLVKNTPNKNIEVVAIHLYPDILKNIYLDELPTLVKNQQSKTQTKRIVDEIIIAKFIESLDFYFENPALVNDDLLELKIKELILLLVQTRNINSIQALIMELYSSKTPSLKALIDLHMYSNLTVEELAKLAHMSLSSFKREFKKLFNDSPANFISSKKITKSKELLTLTEMSISEIAFEVGFSEPLYFSRVFKKREGLSPSAFRSAILG